MTILSRIALFPIALAFAAGALATPASAGLQTVHVFCRIAGCSSGNQPVGGLLADSQGNFYGTTFAGGVDPAGGVAFALVPDGASLKYKILHRFCSKRTESNFCADGAEPEGSLIEDVQGNLYGTTISGGVHNAGTVFELIPNADRSKFRLFTLYNFCVPSCGRGLGPNSGLTYAGQQSGALYDGVSPLFGTTFNGGQASDGVAYQLTFVPGRIRRTEKVIYSFCAEPDCADGQAPVGLVIDAGGNLFGATQNGGANSAGLVFELSPQAGGFVQTVLYNFCSVANCADGRFPADTLAQDSHGNLVGTTQQGGQHNSGTVFKVFPTGAGSKQTVLYSFCSIAGCLDGALPRGRLAIGPAGAIFGTTAEGGTADFTGGTLYKLKGTALTTLYSFCSQANCADGKQPTAGAILDASGNLFGTTSAGGSANNGGTVFTLKP